MANPQHYNYVVTYDLVPKVKNGHRRRTKRLELNLEEQLKLSKQLTNILSNSPSSLESTICTDICVIGGGPAGATVARRLALLGHEVCLIEKAIFPRRQIGESLPPGILPVLDALGLRHTVEAAGFLRNHEATILWSKATDPHKSSTGAPGFQVDRGRFDALLLKAAIEAGVNVIQGATASTPQQADNAHWQLDVNVKNNRHKLLTHYLIDASGKGGLLPGKRQRTGAATLALYGYWQDIPIHTHATCVEAGANAWYWAAPLPDGSINAAIFIDPKDCPQTEPAREHFYRQHLASSELLAPCLSGTLITPVFACNASPYQFDDPIGESFIRVGDAAFAIDPLSSQGVQKAMSNALQASIVVHTLLTRPESTSLAQQFYRERQQETVNRNRQWAASFYAEQDIFPASNFWQCRAHSAINDEPIMLKDPPQLPQLDSSVQLCRQAEIIAAPVVNGDFIVEQAALIHPHLDRPIAYLGNAEIMPLLATIKRGDTVRNLLMSWAQYIPPPQCHEILHWLWMQRIVIPDA